MSRTVWILVYWLTGFVFWLPSIVIHAIRGQRFGSGRFDFVGVSLLPIVSMFFALKMVYRVRLARGLHALLVLLGIWMLGPLSMMISSSFSGGGFTQSGTWHILLNGVVQFVPLTFMMSTYDGTLLALIIVTIWFIIAAILGFARPPDLSIPNED